VPRATWQALRNVVAQLSNFGTIVYAQNKDKTWADILESIREALRDPTTEAAELLGVNSDAGIDEVKRAYKRLALRYHPDKQQPGMLLPRKEAAEAEMARVNWAKEVMLRKLRE